MRVVCAPDSFKESMTALVAAEAMAEGVRRVVPGADCVVVPMADGGEGTVEALQDALGGSPVSVGVHDALGRPATAAYTYVQERRLAVIELAAASGLELIDVADRDVLRASTFGSGELIRDALDRGARRFIVGIGGSATNDAGAGLFAALGVRFLDASGAELPAGGAALARLTSVDLSGLDPRIAEAEFEVAVDVDNPLLGARGASRVFGPQKGATEADVAFLDRALGQWADVVEPAVGRAVRDLPGAGAGGGVGAGFAALTRATLRPGVQIVIDAVRLGELVTGADLVLTGEGRIDVQTLSGKTPWGVAQVAIEAGVPVVVLGGSVAPEARALLDRGVTALLSITRGATTLPAALADGPANLADTAEAVVAVWAAARGGRQRRGSDYQDGGCSVVPPMP